MAVLKRVLQDAADVGLLVIVFVFLYGLFYAFQDVLAKLQSSYVLEILASTDPLLSLRSAFYSALSELSDPLTLLAVLIYGLLLSYLSLVVIGWIGKKRVGYPENPFKRAVSVLIPYIILGIIVFAPVSLIFSLMLYFAGSPTLLYFFFALFILFLFIYTPVVAPALPALVIDSDSISTALRDGLLVGRRKFWSVILNMIAISLVSSLLLILFNWIALFLPTISDFLLILYQAISFILPLAVISEIYVIDTHGE